ncbi:MAG: type II secretion system protein [bacterium]|nr:type II secretion system protein [bacterium]
MKRQKGFTLIELMIVIAIIGILSVVAIPKFVDLVDKAKEAATKGSLGALRSAIAIYYGDNEGRYPYALDNGTYNSGGINYPAFLPTYIDEIPKVKLRKGLHKDTNSVSSSYGDKGGWWYDRSTGKVRIDCGHVALDKTTKYYDF